MRLFSWKTGHGSFGSWLLATQASLLLGGSLTAAITLNVDDPGK